MGINTAIIANNIFWVGCYFSFLNKSQMSFLLILFVKLEVVTFLVIIQYHKLSWIMKRNKRTRFFQLKQIVEICEQNMWIKRPLVSWEKNITSASELFGIRKTSAQESFHARGKDNGAKKSLFTLIYCFLSLKAIKIT